MYKFLMALGGLTTILAIAGCNSIPEGNPPEQIVEEQNSDKTFSSAAGVNQLITSLSAAVIKKVPANSIVSTKFTAEEKSLNFYANKVFASVVELGKFRPPATPASDVDYCLQSHIKGKDIIDWEMKLTRVKDNTVIWTETIKIDQSELIKQ
jgi:hypothetical protein